MAIPTPCSVSSCLEQGFMVIDRNVMLPLCKEHKALWLASSERLAIANLFHTFLGLRQIDSNGFVEDITLKTTVEISSRYTKGLRR
jgi:hypothetical protein